MNKNILATRAYVTGLKADLEQTERLALALSATMNPDQLQKLPEEYRLLLSKLMEKKFG